MGCCQSSEKPTVYEVTIDDQGIARHVPEGQGTHFIRVSDNNETILEEKPSITENLTSPNPTFQTPMSLHSKRIHPLTTGEKKDPETKS
ncbi:hypothetical protein DM01DRAFT_1122246 [Hesseltinella vesiculosa]|uniref:Uncharacterized protein n=1 Tax=Hesseltinella vesiculosa TaxID=101127 RepID=A0A1X2GTW7_9FUNG|nr:hypothetical protein DM01DRAFT_1122246 [Hesseltinella vesiculosa]